MTIHPVIKRRYQPYDLGSLATCETCVEHFGIGWKLYDRWLDEAVMFHAAHRLGIEAPRITVNVSYEGKPDDSQLGPTPLT